ncbi:MAG: insulinase family protein [Chloroflexota bacterium]|nr:insulinase family protein [Chloroflexota bacterium]
MTIHGFELVEERFVPEINSQALVYRHVKTGARLLALENDDENKVFGIAFATPPEDSTGLPHILEHSVLSGSESYPVKEPFKELRKGSLNTFLNAFTAPDKTMYPVASQNLQDFYNLISVYLDAVFKPFITPETLQTEGWHYELESADSQLTYKGVVFNEMKGVYSSPDSLIGRYTQQSLFPDNVYSLDSGGDPTVIPDLTYEQFKSFYQRHYHPSNSYIFFYGDDPSDDRFRLVDAYLSGYEAIEPAPPIALQPRFAETRRFTFGYDAGSEGEEGNQDPVNRSFITVNWMFDEITDIENTLALEILSHTLVGSQASPLRKALIDSGLGENLTGQGYDSAYRQGIFSTGLKGIAAKDADKVEQLVLDTLTGLARDGIDPDMIAASLNTMEFRLREANTGSFPRGLARWLTSLYLWQHGGDPIDALAFEAPLNSVKANVEKDPRYFEELIESNFLNNPHRTVVLLQPDSSAREEAEAAERTRLEAARSQMEQEDLQRVMEEMNRLKKLLDMPDSPEDLATIPTLTVDDLDREIKKIPIEETEIHGVPVLTHDIATNGILYLQVGFNLQTLPQDLLPYAGLFGRLLLGMGTEEEDYVKLSQRIGRETGGISATTHLATSRPGDTESWFFLDGKATVDKSQALLDILRDVLLSADLDNQDRFRQIVLERKAGLEAGLIPSGHSVVFRRLRSHFRTADWLSDQMHGVDQIFFLRQLIEWIDQDWPAVLVKLEQMRDTLVDGNSMLLNVTLDHDAYDGFQPQLATFIDAMPKKQAAPADWQPEFARGPEGLTIPSMVNYVGKGANLYDLGYELDGSSLVVVKFMDNTWLWDQVRVQGGAYGGFGAFNNISGMLAYLSYRDPNLENTLTIYDATADYLREVDLTQEDVDKIIIGVIGGMDQYMLPDTKGFASMTRHLDGNSDEIRQRLRNEVLTTEVRDFRSFADLLDLVAEQGDIVVLGSEQAISEANQSLSPPLSVTKVL